MPEAAGEVVQQVVQSVGRAGVSASWTPAVVDEVVVPWLASLVEQPSVWFAIRSVLANVLREDRDELVRQVDRALRLVLRCPDHHGDLSGCSDEIRKVRLITRMAYGFASPEPLIALALLNLGGHRPSLPGRK